MPNGHSPKGEPTAHLPSALATPMIGKQYAGLVKAGQYIIHRGDIVRVIGVTLYMPGSHPQSCIDNRMTAAKLVTEHGERWCGQDYMVNIYDADAAIKYRQIMHEACADIGTII